MIVTTEVFIKICESNKNHYYKLGFSDIELNDVILIPVALLTNGSNTIITCECDKCSTRKDVIYKNYIKYLKKYGEMGRYGDYYCRKCSEFKRKETLQLNYGVDYPIQNQKIKEKIYNKVKELYGVNDPSKLRKKAS